MHQRMGEQFQRPVIVQWTQVWPLQDGRDRDDVRCGQGAVSAKYVVDEKSTDAAVAIGHRMEVNETKGDKGGTRDWRSSCCSPQRLAQTLQYRRHIVPVRSRGVALDPQGGFRASNRRALGQMGWMSARGVDGPITTWRCHDSASRALRWSRSERSDRERRKCNVRL